jgi:D-alanine-D-alanine ligase
MTRTVVGVLRGGTSSEYNLSLKTGAAMMQALPVEKYEVRDILIDRSGMWHLRGAPSTPVRAITQVDVILNALHGGVGEDGTVQRILERSGTPYAGSRGLASAMALNKIRSRDILLRAGVRMPRALSFSHATEMHTGDMASAVFEQFGPPYVVKPPSEGAGSGIRIAKSIVELPHALGDSIDEYGAALVEEYIRGQEASIGMIEHFRGEDLYALPPAHVSHGLPFFDLNAHHTAAAKHVVPSPFSYVQKLSIADIAKRAHQALSLSHFSRADLMVTPRAIYLLEINAIPGLYPGSSFPHMLESVGSSIAEFLEHAIYLARRKV